MMKKKDQKTEELTNLLKKIQADFENYKKRTEKEKQDFASYGSAALIEKILPILDAFELALKNTSKSQEFVKGVELIYSQLWETLEKEGLTKINALNQKFDPYLHEALMQESSDKEDGTILEELQKGYKFKDAVLRHTKVKISKNEDKNRFIEHGFIPNSRIKKIVFFNTEGDTVILKIKTNWEE